MGLPLLLCTKAKMVEGELKVGKCVVFGDGLIEGSRTGQQAMNSGRRPRRGQAIGCLLLGVIGFPTRWPTTLHRHQYSRAPAGECSHA
jgi:hypothetical protein